MASTPRIREKQKIIDSFLNNYKEGDELKIYLSSGDKKILEEYILNHPKGGKNFYFSIGFLKTGFLEIDFRLRKK